MNFMHQICSFIAALTNAG